MARRGLPVSDAVHRRLAARARPPAARPGNRADDVRAECAAVRRRTADPRAGRVVSPPPGASPPSSERDRVRRRARVRRGSPWPASRAGTRGCGCPQVQFRLGSRFFSVWWLLPGRAALGGALVAAAKLFIATGAGPVVHPRPPVRPEHSAASSPGVQWWVIVTHLANFFFMVMIVRAGWQILADHPRLYVEGGLHARPRGAALPWTGSQGQGVDVQGRRDHAQPPRSGCQVAGTRSAWPATGTSSSTSCSCSTGSSTWCCCSPPAATSSWCPTSASILPDAGSCIVQYSALHLPPEPGGYFRFDAIQQLSYFGVVFLLGPLAILSGLAMSPALDNRFRFYQRIFGNRQAARTLHFLIMCAFVLFYAVHMTMVAATGFAKNLDAITLGVSGTTSTVSRCFCSRWRSPSPSTSGRSVSPGPTRGCCSGSPTPPLVA